MGPRWLFAQRCNHVTCGGHGLVLYVVPSSLGSDLVTSRSVRSRTARGLGYLTIVNRNDLGAELSPLAFVAVIVAV